jgi:serine/threonine protein phosphatase PrpC
MNSIVFSHKGKRDINQDFVLTERINSTLELFLITDGMGGYENGETAAKLVAENVLAYLSTIKKVNEKEIQHGINKANLAIKQKIHDTGSKMGATAGGVVVFENQVYCFWVGDVMIFHFNKKKLQFESSPHTLINKIKKNGSLKSIENISKYRHVVTKSIQGEISHSTIDYHKFGRMTEEDLIIICSDGVHDIINGFEMEGILSANNSIRESLSIFEQRCFLESKDNFSLILIQF